MPVADNQRMAWTTRSPQSVWQSTDPPPDFSSFFRSAYRRVVQTVMYTGGVEEDAEEAAAAAMEEVLRRWNQIDSPLAYARKAAVSHFLKEKERGIDRVRQRLSQRVEARNDGVQDSALTIWEDRQWVTQVLNSLPDAQREVMCFIVDGFAPSEVAVLLGKSGDAVRQNLRAARIRLTSTLLKQGVTAPNSPISPAGEGRVPDEQ